MVSADLLIHVRDVAHPDTEAQRTDVEAVLAEIGVSETTPRIEAWNKLDLLDPDRRDALIAEAGRRDDVVAISALRGEGVPALTDAIAERLTSEHRRYRIMLGASDGAGAAWLHAHGEVLGQEPRDDQVAYDVRLAERDHERFLQRLEQERGSSRFEG